MKKNVAYDKSYAFALRIIKLYKHLSINNKEYILSRQLLKSGTSIGANIREAVGAQSKKDFISKIQIAYKESLETEYWLNLLKDSEILNKRIGNSLSADCSELIKLLSSILKTSKTNS